MKIKDIPHNDIKTFLKVNNIPIVNFNKDYDNAWKLMNKNNAIYVNVPDSIILWMMAYNLFEKKINVPFYTREKIQLMSEKELISLSKLLEMKSYDKTYIIEILKYLDKLRNNPNCKLFDEAFYDMGEVWCWFWIKHKHIIAIFRLYMDDERCKEMVNIIDCNQTKQLSPNKISEIFYNRESLNNHTIGSSIDNDDINIKKNFEWLNEFISHDEIGYYYTL